MSEGLKISAVTREEQYKELLPQIEALVTGESDIIANLANMMAALKTGMRFFWVGCYLVKGEQLVLGPFQGTVACTRINKGKGVCGRVWEEKRVIVVADVDQFPGHIACSSESKSEIVLPVFNKAGEVVMVLDVDSDQLNDFDEVDKKYLSSLAVLIGELI